MAEEFLRRFTVEAYYEEFREVTSHWNRSLLPKMERSFRNSPQWHQFEAELLAVAERQAGLEAGTPGNDAGSRRAADTVMAPAPALTTQATGQITTPRTVKDELVELLDRIVYEQGTTLEKWAHFHKIGRTTLLDWKALRLAGKPLKGKVSAKRTPKSRLQSEKMHERSNSNSDSDSDLLGLARTRPRKCCREILAAWCRITGFTAQSRANSAKRYPSKVATQSRISFQDSPDEARTPLRAGQQIWVRTPDG